MSIDKELSQMITEYRMDSMGDIMIFKEWQKEDGSKEGLLRLLVSQDEDYIMPSKRGDKMKMYERFIPESESILMEFCKIEGCEPEQVKAATNKSEHVTLREKFTAYAYLKGLKPKDMAIALNQHRCNFYYTMRKESWKENIKRYEQYR